MFLAQKLQLRFHRRCITGGPGQPEAGGAGRPAACRIPAGGAAADGAVHRPGGAVARAGATFAQDQQPNGTLVICLMQKYVVLREIIVASFS